MQQLTVEINPRGNNIEAIQADLIRQLKLQNVQLQLIISDLYKEIEKIKKETKK